MALRHFLTLRDLSSLELKQLLARASELRQMQHKGELYQPFVGKEMGMIFEKSSTRTRISFEGKTVSWIGDGNNMCTSYMEAAHLLGFNLKIATPQGYTPKQEWLDEFAHCVELVDTPEDAAANADLIVTDVWSSMGQEEEQKLREKAFARYQVNEKLMSLAHADCLFMHCLPAHRGEEISETMLEHPNSVVWDEAENRLHAQKALVEFLLKQAQT